MINRGTDSLQGMRCSKAAAFPVSMRYWFECLCLAAALMGVNAEGLMAGESKGAAETAFEYPKPNRSFTDSAAIEAYIRKNAVFDAFRKDTLMFDPNSYLKTVEERLPSRIEIFRQQAIPDLFSALKASSGFPREADGAHVRRYTEALMYLYYAYYDSPEGLDAMYEATSPEWRRYLWDIIRRNEAVQNDASYWLAGRELERLTGGDFYWERVEPAFDAEGCALELVLRDPQRRHLNLVISLLQGDKMSFHAKAGLIELVCRFDIKELHDAVGGVFMRDMQWNLMLSKSRNLYAKIYEDTVRYLIRHLRPEEAFELFYYQIREYKLRGRLLEEINAELLQHEQVRKRDAYLQKVAPH